METIDDPSRIACIRHIINQKLSLRRFYEDAYRRYTECLKRCPQKGLALELGSGAGFAKDFVPDLITSDILAYKGMDLVVDGSRLPFSDESLLLICMLNTFHHIPDVASFFQEAQRCLVPGGRIFIIDQHLGYISTPILKYLHHEPICPETIEWKFKTTGPLSGANGALAWIIFVRDIELFKKLYPYLKLIYYRPHTPLLYWMSGGLKHWNLVPEWTYDLLSKIDRELIRISPQFGSFVDIEIEKQTSL